VLLLLITFRPIYWSDQLAPLLYKYAVRFLLHNSNLNNFVNVEDNDDDDVAANSNNNDNNNNYGIGLPHTQGYYDDDRSTDEGMHRIKPGH